MLQVGDVIGGRLRVDRVIGIGGMGVVAAATHLELRHTVAVKMLKPEMSEDTEIVERFLREARAVAQLRTEHVCRVFDVGRTEDGTPYIVMELLQGSDVASMIRSKPLPIATAIDFVMQACVALAEAHAHGIVHRDLKPPNLFVMRRPDGGPLVKVLDFGIAKAADELRLTHSMTMLGSPQYMSPEQLTTPRDVDARTDIWSLGVTIYQLITRRLAFPSAQIGELAVMITSEPPQLDEAPIDLHPVIARCLEKDRDARYPDIGALAAALVPFGGPSARAYAALVRTPAAPQVITNPGLGAAGPPAPIGQNAATVASVATNMPQRMPAMMTVPSISTNASSSMAAPAPRRSRALLWVPLGVALVGAGLVGGYLMRGSTTEKPAPTADARIAKIEIDAAVVAKVEIDAAVVAKVEIDAPLVAKVEIDAPLAKPMVDAAVTIDAAVAKVAIPNANLSDYERALADVEDRIRNTSDKATLQKLYYSAVSMWCALERADKAKTYYALVTDETLRDDSRADCKQHGIEL